MKRITNITSIIIGLSLIAVSVYGYNQIQYKKDLKQKAENIAQVTDQKLAYFAGGCFWCVESGFEKYKDEGVLDVISGYAGGTVENPTYAQVGQGKTGHREAVKVIYDPSEISYDDLLQIFWRLINPTDTEGQYVDRGFVYTSAIYYQDESEQQAAEQSKTDLTESGRYGDLEVITPIIPYTNFYDAEEYHQDFYIKSPIRYNGYTNNSGRKQYLEKTWGEELYYKK